MPHDHPDHEHVPQRVHFRAQSGAMLDAGEPDAKDAPDPEPLARGAGRGKLLFLDAFSGIAGDMLVAGLFDLGVPRQAIAEGLRSLPLTGYELCFVKRTRSGISARGLHVVANEAQPSRDYAAIRALIEAAKDLPSGARALSLAAFRVLAEAEAEVHDSTPEQVHFHEVGAIDSIVDIVAAAIAIDYLDAEIVCSPLPMGRGLVRSQHGMIPSPAPATVLCLAGVPTCDAGIDAELVTPTGACLVRVAATRFARWPNMLPLRVGWGAGTRELADRPNLLRVVLGDPAGAIALDGVSPSHVLLELNVDDMTGEIVAVALERAQQAGALDVWSTPIGMKKGRPALMLSALVRRTEADAVARALLSETTSLGLRVRDVGRIERTRHMIEVQTPYGTIAVKVAGGDGLPENLAPEHEVCRRAAEAHGVPVKQVYAAAIAACVAQRQSR